MKNVNTLKNPYRQPSILEIFLLQIEHKPYSFGMPLVPLQHQQKLHLIAGEDYGGRPFVCILKEELFCNYLHSKTGHSKEHVIKIQGPQ